MIKFFKSLRVWNLFLTQRFFYIGLAVVFFYLFSYFFNSLVIFGTISLLFLVVISISDTFLLFRKKNVVSVKRLHADKLSNGDKNTVDVFLTNNYPFRLFYEVIDEIPHQFQIRDFSIKGSVKSEQEIKLSYYIRPVKRGEYDFGNCNIFCASPLGLIRRKIVVDLKRMVPVYPSIIQMRQYDIFAISNRLTEVGAKKIRRPGASMEFDQIRTYIRGDDIRKINWKATARKQELMVNQFRDERSQHIYSVIDMGRVMKMAFREMTLFDYAINTSLVISNIALRKEDKAGIITFKRNFDQIVPAERRNNQILNILEALYKADADYEESNYEDLVASIFMKLKQRSLILLYTNFETVTSMNRNLKYLKMIAKRHMVVVIFFENVEIKSMVQVKAKNLKEIYIHTIGEKFIYEKRQIVKELERNGINAILTSPEKLTVDTINKYLELKTRGRI